MLKVTYCNSESVYFLLQHCISVAPENRRMEVLLSEREERKTISQNADLAPNQSILLITFKL